jgi:hypothetical protein
MRVKDTVMLISKQEEFGLSRQEVVYDEQLVEDA